MTNDLGAAEDPSGLLVDLNALRARTRRDRNGYWLPMLIFGAAILAAPLAYQTLAPPPSVSARASRPCATSAH